jgi:tetratricopeptide (TPR) repeat protein
MRYLLCGFVGMLLVANTGLAGTFEDALKAFNDKQYEQAIKLLDDYLKDNKDDYKAYQLRGQAHANTKAYAEAMADFNKVIELKPNNATAYLVRGKLYAIDQKVEKAMADYDKAIELAPKQPAAYVERGFLHLGCPMPECKDKAFQDFDQALKVNKDLPLAYLGRARAVLEKSPREATIKQDDKVFTVIIGVQPSAAQQALPDLDKAISLLPKAPNPFLLRAMCQEALGDEVKEVADRKEVAALDMKNDRNLNRLAWVLASSSNNAVRDGKAALEVAKQAAELTMNKDAYVLDTLACACAAAGDFKEAVATQEKVIAMLKAPPKSVFHERLDLYRQNKPYLMPAREPGGVPPTPAEPPKK